MTQPKGPKKMQKGPAKVPDFASREEMAEFWDTHDFTDYQHEFKPVKVRFAKYLSEGLNIRLDKETLARLRTKAHERGIGPTPLARMWILEHLQELREKEPHHQAS